MPIGQANNQTFTTKQGTIYSDFTNNLNITPFSNDIARITNENDVRQSLQNIVLTKAEERLYDNTIGPSNLIALFELDDSLSSTIAIQTIKDTLAASEPRATILQVTVQNNPDQNYMIITIYFTVINNTNILSTQVVVNRIR